MTKMEFDIEDKVLLLFYVVNVSCGHSEKGNFLIVKLH